MTVRDEVFEKGLALRREMFGAAGSDRALETASENSLPLQEMVTRRSEAGRLLGACGSA